MAATVNKRGVAYLDRGHILHIQPIYEDAPDEAKATANALNYAYNGATKLVEVPNFQGNPWDARQMAEVVIYNDKECFTGSEGRIRNTSAAYPELAALWLELYTE